MPPKSSASGKRKNQEKAVQPDEKLSKVDISTSDPRTIVLMLDSPEINVISKACETLQKYLEISEQNILEIVELGGIPKILKLISSPDKISRCHAIVCLCAMAPQATVRRLLYKSDCIPALLKLLQPDEEQLTQDRASFLLTLLAADYSFKVVLGEHDAHKPLLVLIQANDPDIQRNSIKVLCQLMENFKLRPALLKDDGLPLIIKLLDSEYAVIQEMALETLRSCIHHAPSRQVVAGGEGLSKLVSLLGEESYADIHVLAVEVLGLCLGDTDSMSILQGSGCLQQLLAHITDSSSQLMKKAAIITLASAATDTLNRKILHESQVESTFIQLLSKEDGGVVEAICTLLSNMAVLNTSRQLIGREGGVVELVKQLKNTNSVKAAAVHCLACLLQDSPSNCKIFAENDGVKAILPLFSDNHAVCRHFAAECVTSVSCDESIRHTIASSDKAVWASLISGLSFQDSSVQSSTAQALGMLACDQLARKQICNSGGLSPLIKLFRSSKQEVVKNATWMLMVCAQCPQVAEEVCRLSGIQLMRQVAASGDHHCTIMAECALERLFAANLPAKYWVTGSLDMTDSTVNTEFYDAGPAYSSCPFVPLSVLLQQPLKDQPIITANLLAKPRIGATTTPTIGPVNTSNINEDVPATTVIEDGQSNTSISSGSRKGSRLHTSKLKRGKTERESESRVSQDNEGIVSDGSKIKLPGQLEFDQGLWDHIQQISNTIKPLPTSIQQLQEIARYVSSQLGGPVERSGPLCFELPAGHIQQERQSNLVPLGELHKGSFQHRALLYKVLCDHLGLPCSLVRGEYSRHWNIVSIKVQEDSTQDEDSSPSAQDGAIPSEQDSTPNAQDGEKEHAPNAQDEAKEHAPNAQDGEKEHAPNAQDGEKEHAPNAQDGCTPSAKDSTSNDAFILPVHDHKLFLVDLMFSPGTLLPSHSPQAVQYQHLI